MERSLLGQVQRIGVADFEFIVGSRAALDGTGHRPVPTLACVFLNSTGYCSDFGSERFLGLFLSRSATSSAAQAGLFTFPPRMISFALSLLPYNFSFALPSERRVEPSS